jgi:hypothetical protein
MMRKLAVVLAFTLVPTAAMAQDDDYGDWGETPAADPAPAAEPAAAPTDGAGVFAAGTMGLSFAVPSGGGTTFGIAYFLAPDTSLRLETEFTFVGFDDVAVGLSVFAGYRMYKKMVGALHTYLEPFAFIGISDFGEAGDVLELGLGAAIGVEYMFTERFSISGGTGGLLAIGPGFDPFVLSISTVKTNLFANFYW